MSDRKKSSAEKVQAVLITKPTHKRLKDFADVRGLKLQSLADKTINLGLDAQEKDVAHAR